MAESILGKVKGQTIERNTALLIIEAHGSDSWSLLVPFYCDLGVKTRYSAKAVYEWLGY